MKTFAAALLFAGATAAGTSYTAAGGTTNNATGIASSKFTALVTLTGTSLTTKNTQSVTASAALGTNGHDIASVLCTLREASKSVCSYCDVSYTADATKYSANHGAYTYAATAPTLAAGTTALTAATNLTIAGALEDQADIAWGTTVASPATDAGATGWKLNSIKASTDKKTLDCDATYTDPTAGTAARETATKGGMATAYAGTSSGLAARASKLATIKLVTGALSNIATVGAAVAALAMSF